MFAAGYRNNSTAALNNVGSNGNYWSSTVSGTNARNLNFNSTNAAMNNNNRANGFSVRCLKDWPDLGEGMKSKAVKMDEMNKDKMLLRGLFQAYYDARKNKRSSIHALAFEMDYETKLFELYEEIRDRKYEIGKSICFISFDPVMREIFAADFRDRVVHHFIYNHINPVFEPRFIYDSYSCRVGKGTSRGIKRLDHFIRSCSSNYTRDCYVLKMDIEGYFMCMDRSLLYQKITETLNRCRDTAGFDMDLMLYLIQKVIFHDPVKHCVIKGKKSDWEGLPESKSLFFAGEGRGLPIGNLTSQLFGNIYLNEFDHFVKGRLGIRHYGRYVDDMVMVHPDKEYLKGVVPAVREYLEKQLFLRLHPGKTYLQHFSKGVGFLGTVVKPHRIYVKNRIKGSFYRKIQYWNNSIRAKRRLAKEELGEFLSGMNSYLGLMKNFQTYKLRRKMLRENLSAYFWNYVYISGGYGKLVPKVRTKRQKDLTIF